MLEANFAHIYVEDSILNNSFTASILSRFPKAQIISIDHYKDVFNKPRQSFRDQKKATKLILAQRRDQFLYKGSHFAQNFGTQRFFYNTLALNCLYDCSYCYLQGMFPSANLVVFVNNDDFLRAVETELKNGSIYLALSYDTDLLALEPWLAYCEKWIDFVAGRDDIRIEIRTKSGYKKLFSKAPANPNTIFAWTLSPDEIVKRFEPKTASLSKRIQALKTAAKLGWPVRVCIDPMLWVKDWQELYAQLVDHLYNEGLIPAIRDVSFGTFRISSPYLKTLRRQHPDNEIVQFPFHVANGNAGYQAEIEEEMLGFLREKLLKAGFENHQLEQA